MNGLRRAIVASMLVACSAASATDAPRRIVSANLCADELLLDLADRDQIASVSILSSDPALSALPARVADIPKNRGSVEEIVRMDSDLVLTGSWLSPFAKALLKERGVEYIPLAPWTSLESGVADIRRVAQRVGHAARGEALIERIERARDALVGLAPAGRTFLVLHRRGYVPGRANLAAQMIELTGLRDLSVEIGLSAGGFARLEDVLSARPDYLVVAGEDSEAVDQGSSLLRHPALDALYPPAKRLALPDQLTLCAGPSTPAMLERLAREIRSKAR